MQQHTTLSLIQYIQLTTYHHNRRQSTSNKPQSAYNKQNSKYQLSYTNIEHITSLKISDKHYRATNTKTHPALFHADPLAGPLADDEAALAASSVRACGLNFSASSFGVLLKK